MTQLLKLTVKIIFVTLGSAYLMSCTGGNVSSSFGMSSSGTAADDLPPGMSSGVVDPSLFYVGVDSSVNDIAHVHQEGLFGTACAIDPTSKLQDIKCIVDSPEAEIFMHGLALKYNVPPAMCRFLARETYWFWNHEIGVGPTAIEINMTVTDGVVTASSCRFNNTGAFGACDANNEVFVNTSSPSPVLKCVYDHSDSQYGKNGCFGDYNLTINTTTVTSGPPPTSSSSTSVTTVNWGGSYGPLIGGAGHLGWETGSNGIPSRIYKSAHLGVLNQIYNVPSPISSSGGSLLGATTMEIANYSTPSLNTHHGYTSGAVSNLPYALEPIDDFSGSPIPSGNESYLYECVDQAHEILHRIRLYVREWDTYQDYYDYITTKGVTEVPDRRVGSEGATCNGIHGPCNDYADLDDIVATLWVSYTTVVPVNTSDANVARRRNYFPQILPK